MKAYKVEILIIDHDGLGAESIKDTLENTRYPNWCICPDVKSIEGVDIGEWSDEHPLNHRLKANAEYDRLFPKA